MIYKHRITFRKMLSPGGYDNSTGKTLPPTFKLTLVPCEISPVSSERTMRLFGSITIKAFVVRLQRTYTEQYQDVTIDGKPYEVLRHVNHDPGRGIDGLYVKEKV